MQKNLPIGVDNFRDLVDSNNKYLFADKTLFIKEIIEDGSKVILITRPRRWGKTLNMSMLHHFFAEEVYGQKTHGMFDSYAIAKESDGRFVKEYQGKYPVIFISFKDIKELDFAGALNKVKGLIQDLYAQHRYLATSSKLDDADKVMFNAYRQDNPSSQDLEKALKRLSDFLWQHHSQPVYILIDEYDTPLNAAYNHYLDEMTCFMKNLFSEALKGNPSLKQGILTGILRISKDSMLSGLNNLQVYTVLNEKYNQHFGFTNKELDLLFIEQGLQKDEAPVKAWYNGYKIGGLTLYNPWSIISALKNNGELRPYWVNTADDSLLRQIFEEANIEIKTKFQQLLEGKSIEAYISETIRYEDIKNDEVSLWSLLLYTGHLKIESVSPFNMLYLCQLAIPNREILALYEHFFLSWIKTPARQMQLTHLLNNLLDGNIEKFETNLSGFLQTAASVHDYANQPEAFYHGFMLALTSSLLDTYYIDSNRESGYGRPDLLLIPKDKAKNQAFILEFKHVYKNETLEAVAKIALKQIQLNHYAAHIKQYRYINTVLTVGLAFDGKKAHCQFEAIPIP